MLTEGTYRAGLFRETGKPKSSPRRAFVRLLEVDPDLASGMTEDEARRASEFLVARTTTLRCGRWIHAGNSHPHGRSSLGALVVKGLVGRRVSVPGGISLELVGPGDVTRPWDVEAETDGGLRATRLYVLAPTEVAWLGHEFASVAVRWPSVMAQLVCRALQRADRLGWQLAISNIVGVDQRLLQLLVQIADRWGIVTQEGVVVRVPLTNEMLGALVGARPPSISSALQKLAREEIVVRRADGSCLLRP